MGWAKQIVILLCLCAAVAFLSRRSRSADLPAAAPATRPAVPLSKLAGNWLGVLKISGLELRLAVKLKMQNERLVGTFDSIDQGASDIPIDGVAVEGSKITFTIFKIFAMYEGKVDDAVTAIDGTFQQGTSKTPLVFKRVNEIPTLKRPQEPKKPYPYREEQVSYESAPDVNLAATITIPRGKGPFPAVVLITGSGPQDRDEALMGHRPFLVLADHLTRAGIAVLRADDRGIGKSTGSFAGATNDDFVVDALAGVKFLKSRSEIDPKKIGLVGHSEGGIVAPKAAVKAPGDIAFIVLLAGPGVPIDEILVRQGEDFMRAEELPEALITRLRPYRKEMFAMLRQTRDRAEMEKKARELDKRMWSELSEEDKTLMKKVSPGNNEAAIQMILTPWFLQLINEDPAKVLPNVKCPVLAMNGERDLQVASSENLPAIKAALEKGGNKDFKIIEFKGLNHLFQHSNIGKVSEYGKIEETFAPEAMQAVSEWIVKHTGHAGN
jgi:pimeloyl-ACP methyl ester carboxylesterase